jgi:hypothetical protein
VSRLERLQRVSFWVAVVSAGAGFLTSAGCTGLPPLATFHLRWLHPFLLVLGAVCGWLSVARGEAIDRERWQIAEDPSLTSGERDYAHRHAERQRRVASTSFLAAPLMLGYWLAYQVEGEGKLLAAQLLPVTAITGAVLALLIGRLRARFSQDGEQPG